MDFINFVQNNGFLTRAFPGGLPKALQLESLDLGGKDKSAFCLSTTEKPAIEVKKWGKWNLDYNAVFMFFYGNILGAEVRRFGFPRACAVRVCAMDVSEGKNLHAVRFCGDSVDLCLQYEYLWYEKGYPVFSDNYTTSHRSVVVNEVFF